MRMHTMRRRPLALAILIYAFVGTLFLGASATAALALTMNSPEVREAVERGVAYLSGKGTSDTRLGALALAGESLLTSGKPGNDPTVAKCAELIQKELGDHNIDKFEFAKFDIYSTGLCIIFLVDRDPKKHHADIECLLGYLRKMQKPHGGWGYDNRPTGDTSMTQYGVLSSWKAMHAGFTVPIESIEKVTTWLLRTQDPSGGYGYQGEPGEFNALKKQDNVKHSLTAAGLGSLYICSDMLGITKKVERREEGVPPSLKEIKPEENKPGSPRVSTRLDPQLVHATEGRGNQWFAQNFKVDAGAYNYYYFYAYERYMSSREHCDKIEDKDPQWYSDIAAYLIKNQSKEGSWSGDCGPIPDTSFAVLFLLRSMKKSWGTERDYGEGLLVGGRGLPKDISKAMLNADGQVVSRPLLGPAEQLLALIESNPNLPDIGELGDLLKELPADQIDALMKKHGDVMRRLVGCKLPKPRIAFVQALGKSRNLDNVEVLLYAMTDPVSDVVLEANRSLNRIRRNPDAVALPDNFTEEDRRLAIEKWKAWYLSIRPDAKLE